MGGKSARIEFKEERICGGVAGCTCLEEVIQAHSVIFIAAEDIGNADTGGHTHTNPTVQNKATSDPLGHGLILSYSCFMTPPHTPPPFSLALLHLFKMTLSTDGFATLKHNI